MYTRVNDGYITGSITGRVRWCEHCGEKAVCVHIINLVLPKGMTVKATILQDAGHAEPTCIDYVGVSCGCYGKFHRQVAHINDSRMHAGAALV